jgi:predicted metal-dependent HD superfamily phosphohydrolase
MTTAFNAIGAERWSTVWRALNLLLPPHWHERLLASYSEPQRHYHTGQHLNECLHEFNEARALCMDALLVELAIWFHDVVYDPRAQDNEERSAGLAAECLRFAKAGDEICLVVTGLVLATKHHVAATPDQALLIDVDLSIFGKPANRYEEYERQIREEYAWVPARVFAEKRAEVLQRFLDRPRIYTSEHFFHRYEDRA